MGDDFKVTGYSSSSSPRKRPQPGTYSLPGFLPVRTAEGEETFVSTTSLLMKDKLTPAILARITWLHASDKREICRLVRERFPQDRELQVAAKGIRSVPDGYQPESEATHE